MNYYLVERCKVFQVVIQRLFGIHNPSKYSDICDKSFICQLLRNYQFQMLIDNSKPKSKHLPVSRIIYVIWSECFLFYPMVHSFIHLNRRCKFFSKRKNHGLPENLNLIFIFFYKINSLLIVIIVYK